MQKILIPHPSSTQTSTEPKFHASHLHAILKTLELPLHLINGIGIPTGNVRGRALGIDILAINHLLDDGTQAGLDVSVGQLGIGGGGRNRLLCEIVKGDDDGEHAHGLGEGTGEVVLREGVLGEEILANELGDLHDHLLILGQRFLPDELHDLGEVVLLLENVARLITQVGITRIHVVKVRLQHLHVLGVGNEPVEGRKVLALRQLLVQAPKHLHDGQRGGRDGIGKVPSGGGHGPHDGDSALAIGRAQARDAAGALVKCRETRPQVRGISGIGGHLPQPSRNLAQRLGPAAPGVSHH
mmetsp:Transcript_12432/g.30395  ORF Transcript_12432/g.30395 Transcript_12432/m.30395 type:complete len:298 (+) Transcript_12432:122-1015(+)